MQRWGCAFEIAAEPFEPIGCAASIEQSGWLPDGDDLDAVLPLLMNTLFITGAHNIHEQSLAPQPVDVCSDERSRRIASVSRIGRGDNADPTGSARTIDDTAVQHSEHVITGSRQSSLNTGLGLRGQAHSKRAQQYEGDGIDHRV